MANTQKIQFNQIFIHHFCFSIPKTPFTVTIFIKKNQIMIFLFRTLFGKTKLEIKSIKKFLQLKKKQN